MLLSSKATAEHPAMDTITSESTMLPSSQATAEHPTIICTYLNSGSDDNKPPPLDANEPTPYEDKAEHPAMDTMMLKWRCIQSNKVVATICTKSNSVHIQWFKSQQHIMHEGESILDDNGVWRATFTFRTMMVPADSIMKKAMFEIRRYDGFDNALVQDDGTMYVPVSYTHLTLPTILLV